MSNDPDYVRKALRVARDELITEIDYWDSDRADRGQIELWNEKLAGLDAMISRAAQETEMHRRQITVIKSEMQAFDRSAKATRILDVAASRGIAAQADLMSKDLANATDLLASMEADENRLRQAHTVANDKISAANERLSSSKE